MLGDVEAVPTKAREVFYKAVLHKACRESAIGGPECTCDLGSTRAGTERERERLSGGCRMQHVRWRGRCVVGVLCSRFVYCSSFARACIKVQYFLYRRPTLSV